METESKVQRSGLAGVNWTVVCHGPEHKAREIFRRQLRFFVLWAASAYWLPMVRSSSKPRPPLVQRQLTLADSHSARLSFPTFGLERHAAELGAAEAAVQVALDGFASKSIVPWIPCS
jgi:hypothetical protein